MKPNFRRPTPQLATAMKKRPFTMKSSLARKSALILAGSVAALLAVPSAQAATIFWDGGTINIAGNGDGASAGGSGTWSTSISNWDVGSGLAEAVWTNGSNDANFGGTAGTVTLGTGVTVGQLSANSVSGYVFAGTNTITLNNGTTIFKTNGTTFNSTVTIATNAKILTLLNTTNTTVISGVISGTGSVTLATGSTGTVTLSGVNTYTGGTTVNAGILQAGKATNAFGNNQGALTVNTGGTVDYNGKGEQIGYLTGTGGTVVNNISGIASTLNLFGNTGSGNYFGVIADNTSGTGTILLNKSGAATQTFSGLNTYTGSTSVAGTALVTGTLAAGIAQSGASGAFGNNSAVTMGTNGILNLANFNESIGSLTGSATTGSVTLGTATLTVGGNNTSPATYAGIISGTGGSLTKVGGTGTLDLSGVNTYTGNTTVSAGTLTISGAGSIYSTIGAGAATVTVATVAQILLSGAATDNALGFGTNETWAVSGTINSTGGSAQTLPSTVTLNNGTLSGVISTGGNAQYGTYFANFPVATITANGASNIINAANIGLGSTLTLATPLSSDALSVSSAIGVVSGQVAGGVTKTGAGTVTLTGTNAYTGNTTLTAGTLNLGVAESVNVSGPLGKQLANAAGTIILNGGTLQYSAANNNDYSGRFSTAASQAYNVDTNSQSVTWATALSSSGGTLSKSGAGTLTLTGPNTYSGSTTISAGTLQIGSAGTLGAGAYAGAIAISLGATLQDSSSAGQTLSGAISGGGAILKDTNTSDLSLTNTGNTYSGTTTVSAGRILVSAPTNLSSGATSLVQSGIGQFFIINSNATFSNNFNLNGTGYGEGDSQGNFDGGIRADGTNTLSGTITLSGNARIGAFGAAANTVSGKITGSAAIEFYGMNSGNNSAEVFTISNSANDYTGATTITNSNYASAVLTGVSTTLKLGASNVIPDGASAGNVAFSINGTNPNNTVTLDLNGFSDTINGTTVNAGANAKITNSATGTSVLTIGANNIISTFGGTITDAGVGKTLAITKTGTGTLTLTGANTYIGNTTVSAGTLALVGGSQTSLITVNNLASLGFTLGSGTSSTSTVNFSAGSTVKITGTPAPATSYTLMTASSFAGITPVLATAINGFKLQVVGGNTLQLVPAAGYSTWAAINAPGSAPGLDYDGDGVTNAVEYILGGDKDTNDLSKLPTVDASGTDLVFTFKRAQSSIDGTTTVAIQVGTTLAAWPDSYNVPETAQANNPGVTVQKDTPAVGTDTVTLRVVKAPDATKFARLVVTPAP